MSADSSWELQKSIYGALTGDSALMAMITGVHDHVPQDTAFPYITIGEAAAIAWGASGVEGIETTMIIHVWSQERGHREVKLIMAEVYRILHDADLPVTGHHLVWLRFEFSENVADPDGVTYHGIGRFDAVTHLL